MIIRSCFQGAEIIRLHFFMKTQMAACTSHTGLQEPISFATPLIGHLRGVTGNPTMAEIQQSRPLNGVAAKDKNGRGSMSWCSIGVSLSAAAIISNKEISKHAHTREGTLIFSSMVHSTNTDTMLGLQLRCTRIKKACGSTTLWQNGLQNSKPTFGALRQTATLT